MLVWYVSDCVHEYLFVSVRWAKETDTVCRGISYSDFLHRL